MDEGRRGRVLRVGAWRASVIVCIAAALPGLALAQPATAADASASASSGVTSYPVAFYAAFHSETALQMVESTPGFTLERGGEEDPAQPNRKRRANVLIDGRTPAGDEPIEVILRRIPASAVERVELVRHGADYDLMGYLLVANVVRRAAAPEAAAAATPVSRSRPSAPKSRSSVTVSSTALPRGLTGGALRAETRQNIEGRVIDAALVVSQTPANGAVGRRVRHSLTSQSIDNIELDSFSWNGRGELRAGLKTPIGAGQFDVSGVASVTESETQSSETSDRGVRTGRSSFNDRDRLEGVVRYSRPLVGDSRLETRLFHQVTRTQAESIFNNGGSVFSSDRTSGASVGSISLQQLTWASFEWQLGASADRTWQEGISSADGFSAAHRDTAELYLSADWPLRSDLDLDLGLWLQHVSLGGNKGEDETFGFLNPRMSAIWSIDEQHEISFGIERAVMPINLDNLTANLRRRYLDDEEGEVVEGAPRLAPETVLSSRLKLQRRFGRGLAFIEFSHQQRQNIVDLRPLPGGGQVYGNVGDGSRQSVIVSIDAPIDSVGVPHAALRLRATMRASSLIDPFTGEERRQSGERPFEWELGFRQELKSWRSRWGVDATGVAETASWWRAEASETSRGPTVNIYVEHTAKPDLTLRAEMRNLNDGAQKTHRRIYSGARSVGQLSALEDRVTRTGAVLYVSARRTF